MGAKDTRAGREVGGSLKHAAVDSQPQAQPHSAKHCRPGTCGRDGLNPKSASTRLGVEGPGLGQPCSDRRSASRDTKVSPAHSPRTQPGTSKETRGSTQYPRARKDFAGMPGSHQKRNPKDKARKTSGVPPSAWSILPLQTSLNLPQQAGSIVHLAPPKA